MSRLKKKDVWKSISVKHGTFKRLRQMENSLSYGVEDERSNKGRDILEDILLGAINEKYEEVKYTSAKSRPVRYNFESKLIDKVKEKAKVQGYSRMGDYVTDLVNYEYRKYQKDPKLLLKEDQKND